ncbi:uncharacterized protein LOC108670548 [Hyalella azteca]|uniref:Uncharacterized protein LOC108670548 n=1 Tax=Hyalella azteca TaxID=294128 RepID=A0A8B7NIN5_HYAAZ|nr:uncharacterized protein LOC108670548 [Hyalella azteca]
MVAITDIFGRKPHNESQGSASEIFTETLPLTPSASDCLSVSGDSTPGSLVAVPVCPIRRNPNLLLERLEKCSSHKCFLGRRKRRKAQNEAALAVLVEGYEEESHLFVKPYRSPFMQLLECPSKMMVWQNFINLSEEEQAKYLSGPRQRSQLFDWTKPEAASEPPSVDAAPAGDSTPADGRSVHPAALPSDIPTLGSLVEQCVSKLIVSDPELGKGLHDNYFASPPRHNDLPFAAAAAVTAIGELPGSVAGKVIALEPSLSSQYGSRYPASNTSPLPCEDEKVFSHCTRNKCSGARSVDSSTLSPSSCEFQPIQPLTNDEMADDVRGSECMRLLSDALGDEALDSETSCSSSFEILEPEDTLTEY